VAHYRENALVRGVAACATAFLEGYENLNYDPRTNGEWRVLRTLAEAWPSTVFDVGANAGDWTSMAARTLPGAVVHAFEIVEPTRRHLLARTRGIPNVRVCDAGLLDDDGEVAVRYFPEAAQFSSVAGVPYGAGADWLEAGEVMRSEEIIARVMRGDAYASKQGIERISLLKIDVEGAEHRVLAGFRDMLASGRIDVVQFEYGMVNIFTRYLLQDFYGFFERAGFEVGKIYPTHVDFRPYNVRHEDFRGPNYLAVRREETGLKELFRSFRG
jgi:FkbM family methyltransferase